MCNIRRAFCLLAIVCIITGCSQTGGVRPGNVSNMRTVASVGDNPLPSVSGEPGASLRADADDLDLPPVSGSRISGRVYDERGKPVPNVKVRLAVSSTPGGKVVYATTDRSGAFTLRGLRSGTSYAVIAEYQGEDGMMTGRTQAKAPQVDVRISLKPRAGEGQGHASIQPARTRVEPISNIDSADDETSPATNGSEDNVKSDDLDLPTDSGASASPRRNVRLSRTTDESSRPSARTGWNSRQLAADGTAMPKPQSSSPTVSHAPESDEPGNNLEDDGPNPLPPALDTTEVSSGRSTDPSAERPIKVARSSTRSSTATARRRSSQSNARDDDKAIGIMENGGQRTPRSMPEDVLPGGKVITPGSFAPIAVNDDPADDKPPAKTPRRSAPASQRRSKTPSRDADSSDPPDSGSPDNQTSRGADRPTWGQVAAKQSAVPLDESIRRTSGASQPLDSAVVTLTSNAPAPKQGRSRLLGGARAPIEEAKPPALCRFDPTARKLVDFQLSGLDGKMVSMHDLDADVILLDFWGSWCAPCRTSIAHLVELQAKLGAKRLQVVGVACEKGATLQDRRASASKAVQELGINYRVLLSSKEGTCPLQQALQIQFYPTMILLDRDGKLLAREQGATEVTMSRMDRAIDRALQSDVASKADGRKKDGNR